MSQGVDPARYAARLEAVRALLASDGDAGLLVGVGPELEWLVGYAAHGLERLNLLVVTKDRAAFVVPRLELDSARAAPGLASGTVDLLAWEETDDPFALVPPALATTSRRGRLLVSDGLRAAFLLGLQSVLPEGRFGLASTVLAPLRRVKDADELALLKAAGAAADRVVEAVVAGTLIGRSEADVAREVRELLVAEGHDTAGFAIVASGPNSASPHHEPGDRVLSAGEPLLLDIGGRLGGYFSDITRTVWVGDDGAAAPDERFREIYGLVEQAQAAGREAVRPGVAFAALDSAARSVIEDGGYGERFFHRLGHGIGLEVHEEPYVVSTNSEPVVAGDTFSIEPGIYLEGRYGVRIEDAVVCTPDGVDPLNEAPRQLRVVPGR